MNKAMKVSRSLLRVRGAPESRTTEKAASSSSDMLPRFASAHAPTSRSSSRKPRCLERYARLFSIWAWERQRERRAQQ